MINKMNLMFLKSATNISSAMVTLKHAISWINEQSNRVNVEVKKIPFSKLNLWSFKKINRFLFMIPENFFL